MIKTASLLLLLSATLATRAEFRAGAYAQDISPVKFPAPVNGSMSANFASGIHDPMHARCLALHDGKRALVFVVVDACLIPREVCEEAKDIASKETGIPKEHMLISATHTHSAAALTPVFQSETDPDYVRTVPPLIARRMAQAVQKSGGRPSWAGPLAATPARSSTAAGT